MEGRFLWFFFGFVTVGFARTISIEERESVEILEEETFIHVEPRIFENKIVEAINKLKDFLQNGNPSNGTPPLDPFFLPYRSFDFILMDTELKGHLESTTFANFSRFEVTNVELKLLPLHFKLDIFLNQLWIDGRYNLLGKILNEIPVNGTGKFRSETKNLMLSLYLRPTQVNSFLQIKDLLVEFKTLSQKINYTNELVDNEIHVMDENLALYILDQVQAKYLPPLLAMVKSILNHFLLGYSGTEIIKIILEFLNKR